MRRLALSLRVIRFSPLLGEVLIWGVSQTIVRCFSRIQEETLAADQGMFLSFSEELEDSCQSIVLSKGEEVAAEGFGLPFDGEMLLNVMPCLGAEVVDLLA